MFMQELWMSWIPVGIHTLLEMLWCNFCQFSPFFLVDLDFFFCNINKNLLIKWIAPKLCELRKCFLCFCFFNYWKSNCFRGSGILPERHTKCPHHLLPWNQTEKALSISQDLAVSSKRGFSACRNTLNTAPNLGCHTTLVYNNTHVRDLLFSLRTRAICKLPGRNSSSYPAGCSCPFEIDFIPIPGSVWSRRTLYAVCRAGQQDTVQRFAAFTETLTLCSSAQSCQEFPRQMAACPNSKPGANSWIVTPAKERESQKHKSNQQSMVCAESFRSEKEF